MGIKRTTADKLFSEIIRERDGWACQRCHKVYNKYDPHSRMGLHCAHNRGRANYNTRFNENNAVALCYGCHQYLGSNPKEHEEFFTCFFGEDVVSSIHELATKRTGGDLPMKSWYNSREHNKQLRERLAELCKM